MGAKSDESRLREYHYISNYNKEHRKQYMIRVRRDSGKDIIDFLDGISDKNAFFVELIRGYMNAEKARSQKDEKDE